MQKKMRGKLSVNVPQPQIITLQMLEKGGKRQVSGVCFSQQGGTKRWGKGKLLERSVSSRAPKRPSLGSFTVCCSFSALTSVQPVGMSPSL